MSTRPLWRREGILVLLVSALSGAGTMVVELAAVRLLAPWFGTSLVVWTNVIAVILLALALGYRLGGQMAERSDPLAIMGWLLVCAGLWIAWLPHLGAGLADWLMPAHLALHEAAGLVCWGSLAVAVVVFLVPAGLLGTVCPLAVERLARTQGMLPGRAGGSVLFASTIGSLTGVFGTSHVLLPGLGTRGTFMLAGLVVILAGAGAILLTRRRPRAFLPIIALAGLGAAVIISPAHADDAPGTVALARGESRYQALRVVEDRSRDRLTRFLRVNEGFDSFQSVWQDGSRLLDDGFYYNDFLLPVCWSEPTAPWHVLVLGLGAGTVVQVFSAEPQVDARFIGVELDPMVVEYGREWMHLRADDERLQVWAGLDARVALRVVDGAFDQIVLDCYANQVEIPPHLCTIEFFREIEARLTEGGWLTANLGGFALSDPVVTAVAQTCARAFAGAVLVVRVPHSRNYMLLARRNGALPWDGQVLTEASRARSLILGPRRLPGFSAGIEADPQARVLTDDWCPVEQLQFRSILEASRARIKEAGR